MNYQILELPLNTTALAIQAAINNIGLTVVSVVADTINNRLIVVLH